MNTGRKITLVHLTDLHFGPNHRFSPPAPPMGKNPAAAKQPSLAETLISDLRTTGRNDVHFLLTGDLTETASAVEYRSIADFIERIRQEFPESRVFCAPGNHDVVYDEEDVDRRWQPYVTFYNRTFSTSHDPANPDSLSIIHDLTTELGLIVAEVNSCAVVQKGTDEVNRGFVSTSSLSSMKTSLASIPETTRKSSIRVAITHHHPVLIPEFVEPKRGYDAILNGDKLVNLFREYGFHLFVHGHKHHPFVFSFDPESALRRSRRPATIVVAGGSAGSTELPAHPATCNTYNVIDAAWDGQADAARIRVETRGLCIHSDEGDDLLPSEWRYKTIAEFDRILMPRTSGAAGGTISPFKHDDLETRRQETYARLRGNMPIVEVIPALAPGQAYEARVSVLPKNRRPQDVPKKVVWSAGPMFEMVSCNADDNPTFSASFCYFGSVLIQARMVFDDAVEDGYVFAHMPSRNDE